MELRDADIAGSMASVRRTGREFSFFFFFFRTKWKLFQRLYLYSSLLAGQAACSRFLVRSPRLVYR